MRHSKLNNHHRLIARLWKQGTPIAVLMKRFGCSRPSIYFFVERHGLKHRGKRKPRDPGERGPAFNSRNVKRIIKLRMKGLNALRIGAKTGLPPVSIGKVLKRHGMHVLTRKQRRDITHRIYGIREKVGIGEDELKRLIGYKRASTELFVKGEGLMKRLNRIAKVLKVPYKKLWVPIRGQ